MTHPVIEIMDTTLRDGEQTSGVSFVPHEKLMTRWTAWRWLRPGSPRESVTP